MQVKVIGAGFSGLVTAYYLVKEGFQVQILEKNSQAGGLIRTIQTEHGPVETAANGIRNSVRFEAMCADIGVPLQPTRREARARFIFRGEPKRFPLSGPEVLKLGFRFAASATSFRPRPLETIVNWGRRVIGAAATDYFLAPALGGIYAGDPERLSASLVFGQAVLPEHLQTTRPFKPKLHGTVAPLNGMQQLIDGLCEYLERAGVDFVFNHDSQIEPGDAAIVCTSARAAAECLAGVAPQLSESLRQIEMMPVVTATCQYERAAARLKGFGCLFPRSEGFRARGVLFNECIFDGRGPAHSETWIFGGALDPDIVQLSDPELIALIAGERERLYGGVDEAIGIHLTSWPAALPHYSIDLERILTHLPAPPPNVALVGNYLGRIGLAKLIERAAFVAREFRGTSPTAKEGS
ncbi:MAG: protoporphyrinogen/coproporphyrinogen oxidase [Blastocatellia bacterium]|jgi:oxygen-dependent protoporphyrinogen oxidase|nr:protoporphyrinogen/coproporphyrinogen oxidase [Blastocatellia bacterium]